MLLRANREDAVWVRLRTRRDRRPLLASFAVPPRREDLETTHVRCVHCRKEFLATALAPGTSRTGYKCPHCNLFMPLERADPDNATVA
jgi:hypothetical protein